MTASLTRRQLLQAGGFQQLTASQLAHARLLLFSAPRPAGPQPRDGLQRALPHDAFGSRMSRSPSPIRLNASTAVMIATPGNTEIHGAVSR